MKIVRVHMRPFAVTEVVEAFRKADFEAMTLSEVQDHGAHGADPASYRGAPITPPPAMRVELMIAIHDERLPQAIEALESCHCRETLTMVVQELERVVRIRTGQIDEAAL